MQKIKLDHEPSTIAKHKPFLFQFDAFEKIKDLEYSAIFHEQGLGKTKIAADLMLYWLANKEIDTVLIVTKKQLVANWVRELSLHTFLTPKILSADRRGNFSVFNGNSRVIVSNYEAIHAERSRVALFLKTRSVAIVMDESTKIKNPDSDITKTFFELSESFKKRVIMTGTPVANRPYDIWAQIFFLDRGESLGRDFNDFKKKTDITNNLSTDIGLRNSFENEISTIMDRLSLFSVRETKESSGIILPGKEIHYIHVDPSPEQKKIYEKIRDEERLFVLKNDEFDVDNSDEILKRLIRLIQAASNPRLITDSYGELPGKYSILIKIISEILEKGEKCIIWTNFIANVEWLFNDLASYGVVKIHGNMDMISRNKSIVKFMEDPHIKLLVATPGSAKEGLTLTSANNAIFYDRSLKLDDYLQAQDRIHRISQSKNCHIYVLLLNNTIDDWVDSLIENKELAAKLTQGDIRIEEYRLMADYRFAETIKNVLSG